MTWAARVLLAVIGSLSLVPVTAFSMRRGLERQTAGVYFLGSPTETPAFTLERVSSSVADIVTVDVWFRDAAGAVALQERVTYQRGRLTRYESWQRQINERYSVRVQGDRAFFETERSGRVSRSEDRWSEATKTVDELPTLVRSNWDALMRGGTVRFRFAILDRADIFGFKIVRAERVWLDGQPLIVFRMTPSNFLIARFVRPIELIFRDDARRTLRQISGPLPVKQRRDGGWKDAAGRLVWND